MGAVAGRSAGWPGRASAGAALLAGLALAALGGCGYGFSTRYHPTGGVDRIHVRAIENLSADPDLGVEVTAALREELDRRGAAGEPDGPAYIAGEVRALEGAPSSSAGTTWHTGLVLHARLVVHDKVIADRTIRREADHLGGADALETEGRRAVALRRLAGEVAHELLRELEAGAP